MTVISQANTTHDPLLKLVTAFTLQPRDQEFSASETNFVHGLLQPKTVVFLAFPIKCGGTFLREVLARCLSRLHGGTPVQLLRGTFMGTGDGERDLYLPNLLAHFAQASNAPAILHNHTTATLSNQLLVNLFALRPVVMERSISDMLRSRYDVAMKSGKMGGHGSAFAEEETFFQLDEEQQKDFLIRNVAPWYVKFYASWWMAEQRGQLDSIHWVRFDDFREDCASVVEGVLEHVGLELDRANIDASIQEAMALREKLRFNKGVSGRGQEFFSERQLEDLKALTATYSQMDFEARGLL